MQSIDIYRTKELSDILQILRNWQKINLKEITKKRKHGERQ